jgi:hypothetical protein
MLGREFGDGDFQVLSRINGYCAFTLDFRHARCAYFGMRADLLGSL